MKTPYSNKTMCPVCGASCGTVKTKQIAPTYRELTLVCTNPDCGHVFVGALTPVRTLEPSRLTNAAPVTKAG